MGTDTKQKNNIWSAIFSTGPDIDTEDSYEIIAVHPALAKVLANIENGKLKKEVEDSLTTNGKKASANNGGFGKKIDPKTEEAMRKIHEQVQQKPVQPRESEGREIDE